MKNFALKIVVFAFSIFVFCTVKATAQACGVFSQTVFVQDEKGRPLEMAVVQFLPITKDETYGKQFTRSESNRSSFELKFQEGQSVKEFHKLIVSADGYKTAENEIKFFSCSGNQIKVKLPKTDSSASPVWEFENRIMISTNDEDGKGVKGVRLSIFEDGKILTTQKMEYYGTGFDMKNGKYVFRFEKDSYETENIEVDLTEIERVDINVSLKSENKTVPKQRNRQALHHN